MLNVASATQPLFSSTGAALFFYVEEVCRRTGIQVPLEVGIPTPRVAREQRDAIYARVAWTLHEREPEDYSFDPPITKARLEALVHWYLTDEPACAPRRLVDHFADALELRSTTWPAFCRECRRTRNVLRRRWQARGLVQG